MKLTDHYVKGALHPPASGRRIDNLNPATGARVSALARGDARDVDHAVDAARAALRGPWGRLDATARAALLDRAADLMAARLDALALMESQDQGKPVALARAVDIPRSIANLRFFAGAVRHQELPAHPMAEALNVTRRGPLGVVALITPWNLPLYLLTWKLAPALAMGNTVVAKPSELTPRTANALAELLTEAGLPPGVFNVVHGLGPEVGDALVGHPDVKAVSFTGGTATGRLVAARGAPAFKKLSLELGGKNATVIFDDADLDRAIEVSTRAAFTNQGEICLCGSRLLVQRGVFERVAEAVAARAEAMVVGDPTDPSTDLGALISTAHRDKVEGYIALGREEGGELLAGGRRPLLAPPFDEGAFLRPTVLTGLAPTCRAATEEIFGPVLTVHPFDDEDEALAIANGTPYGLSASVWTRDLRRAHRVSEGLDVGMVWVNTWMLRDLRVPFGGVKQSGVGREGGRWSLDFFSETKNICFHLGS